MSTEKTSERPVVLVVDDDFDIRGALRDVLEQAGYRVAEAADGRAALEYLANHEPPAAILLDLFMPVMDGWQFSRQLQALPQLAATPLIVLTAIGGHWGYPSARVLRKPVDMNELLEALQAVAPSAPGGH